VDRSEFDRFADEYSIIHARNTRISGEEPSYFHEYKIRDVAAALGAQARSGLRILDFGAGVGNSLPYLRHHLPNAMLTAADVSARSLAIAEQRFPGYAEFRVLDGEALPFAAGSFEVIFTACVFHHIPWSEHVRLLGEMHRLLSPSGRLFIFEHNPWNPLTRHAVNTCPFDENARLISAPQMRQRVFEAGFRHISVRYRLFFPHALAWLRRGEARLAALPFGAQYLVEARRTE